MVNGEKPRTELEKIPTFFLWIDLFYLYSLNIPSSFTLDALICLFEEVNWLVYTSHCIYFSSELTDQFADSDRVFSSNATVAQTLNEKLLRFICVAIYVLRVCLFSTDYRIKYTDTMSISSHFIFSSFFFSFSEMFSP